MAESAQHSIKTIGAFKAEYERLLRIRANGGDGTKNSAKVFSFVDRSDSSRVKSGRGSGHRELLACTDEGPDLVGRGIKNVRPRAGA